MTDPRDMTDAELRTELLQALRGKPRQSWKWIHYGDRRVISPAFTADGTATADGEPERVVLEALVTANRRLHEKRSAAAVKAAATAQRRRALHVDRIVARLTAGGKLQPSLRCVLCGRVLDDPASRARGIGSECWTGVLSAIERAQIAEAPQ